MKKLLNLLLAVTLATTLVACSKEKTVYTAGTYTGSAYGYGGEVNVTIEVTSSEIVDVKIEGLKETEAIGGSAIQELTKQILEVQSDEVDMVSGATTTSQAVQTALQSALQKAKGMETTKKELTDGVYTSSSTGYSWTGMIQGEVKIEDNQIASITITEEHDSETGEMAQTAYDYFIPRMLEHQSLAVDSISGATTTSNAIRNIVSSAIDQAGGNADAWYTEVAKKEESVKLEGYDVIVVGLGGSGILSYCSAAQTGASVFGIETTAKLGGQSATTTGPMVINAESEAFDGIGFANPDEVYQTWIDYVESEEKADIIHEAVYNSGSALDYYIENFGFEFAGMILSFANPAWSQFWTRYVGENGNKNIFGPNKTNQFDRAMEKAVSLNDKNDYKLELTADSLIMDNNEIVGVKAVSYDGTIYEIYGDSVILATGGFIGNEEMVQESFNTSLNTVASLVNDGTGINMGLSVGGATYMKDVAPMIHILQVPNLIKNNDLTADQKAILSALALVKGETNVTINGELLDPTLTESLIPGYKHYVVYTQEKMEQFKQNGLTENFEKATSMFMSQGGIFEINKPVSDMDEILKIGEQYKNVIKANSIEELASAIGCDTATLSTTLNGNETTYYAVIVSGYTYGSVGGLDVNINMNVLREDKTPIENLFAVGTDSMGVENIEGKPYTPWGGQAQSWTFVSGKLGGEAAANYALSK